MIGNFRTAFANKFAVVVGVKEMMNLEHRESRTSVVNVTFTDSTMELVCVVVVDAASFCALRCSVHGCAF